MNSENSEILAFHAPSKTFKIVSKKILALKLPVNCEIKDGIFRVEYQGKCDGNTAYQLNELISSLMDYFGKD
jgi:hypothetical protein